MKIVFVLFVLLPFVLVASGLSKIKYESDEEPAVHKKPPKPVENSATMQFAQFRNCCKDICKLQYEVGPCRAAIPRWYYDIKTKTCKKFTYGGCGGNANNFATYAECKKYCGNQ